MVRATMTRREWAAALAASAAPAALAQAPASEREASPEELLTEAKADVRRSAERLHKFDLPMATEPAFVFKP